MAIVPSAGVRGMSPNGIFLYLYNMMVIYNGRYRDGALNHIEMGAEQRQRSNKEVTEFPFLYCFHLEVFKLPT